MKTAIQQFIYILILLIASSSCDKEEEVEQIVEENYEMTVIAKYVRQSKKYPDGGSKVYIYFHQDLFDFAGMSYDDEGVYYLDDKIIEPDEKYVTNRDGVVVIDLNGRSDMEFSMFVVSQNTGLRAFSHYYKHDFSNTHTFIFNDFEDD